MTKPDDFVRYTIRVPADLYARVQKAAGMKSVNAEIVAALEEKYPPETIDLETVSKFLETLRGISAPDGDKDYLNKINAILARAGLPWSVEAGWDGAVTFYPFAKGEGGSWRTSRGPHVGEQPRSKYVAGPPRHQKPNKD